VEYFTDRDIGGKIFPHILREAGIIVHVHQEHFAQDAPDTVWLPEVAERGWVILSSDKSIKLRPLEKAAVMESGAALFFVVGGNVVAAELARNFVNTRKQVERFIARHSRPFIAKILRPNPATDIVLGKPGKVEMVLTLAQWEEQKHRGR
jgi:hypothetical protein